MAERKRLSDKDTSPSSSKKPKLVQTTLPFGTSTRPLCKYGAKCYRKHPDHLKAFHHPSTMDTKDEEEEEEEELVPVKAKEKTSASISASSSPVKQTTTTTKASSNSTLSLMELTGLDDEQLLSKLYQMEFPTDLYEFWKFCSTINSKHPRGK